MCSVMAKRSSFMLICILPLIVMSCTAPRANAPKVSARDAVKSSCQYSLTSKVSNQFLGSANSVDISNSFMIYDKHDDHLYLIARIPNATGNTNMTTFVFIKSYWRKILTATSPPMSVGASVVYDPEICDVVLVEGYRMFNGSGNSPQFASQNTWIFDGSQWQDPTLSISPPIMKESALFYDAISHNLVLYGLSDTWLFSTLGWSEFLPQEIPQNPPSGCNISGNATDPILKQVVLLCMSSIGVDRPPVETLWNWNGTGWYLLGPPYKEPNISSFTDLQPSPRYGEIMLEDESSKDIILFGGLDPNGTPLNDTWKFNGTVWTEIKSSISLPSGISCLATFDNKLNRIVLFTLLEIDSVGRVNSFWQWSGNEWILGRT